MSDRVRIRDLKFWRQPPELRSIEGGRTNRNYRADAGGLRYFVRVAEQRPEHAIDRATESRAMALAAEAGIAPAVLCEADGVVVTEFLDGVTFDVGTAGDANRLREIARLLRGVHAIGGENVMAFSPVAHCRHYLHALPNLPIPAERFERFLSAVPEIEARCLVHGDPIPQNFIETPQGLYLVDWEYAGRGVPEIDIALVIANFDLDRQQASEFMAAYNATLSRELVSKLRPVLVIREALWCEMQQMLAPPNSELIQYSRHCWARVRELCG